jgi:lambda repressor-like predicted transcriptional regulator
MLIESCVYRAVADLLGKDPWELAPGRYRHI